MKREELEKLGLTKEQIDAVMGIHGADVEANKTTLRTREETITALTTERDGLKTQVADRDKDIAALKKSTGDNEALSKQLGDLQTKYDTETATLKKTLETQAVDHAAESLFSGVEFTSALARKAAMREFLAGNPEFKDGKFTDADGHLKKLREQYPDAFKPNEKPKEEVPPAETKLPQFTRPIPNGSPQGNSNPFDFRFTPVRSAGNTGTPGGK